MSSTRKTALIAGALLVIIFLTSIPAALLLYTPVLDHANYIVGAGADARVARGAFLEVLLIVATAVVLFPLLKRQNEPLALGYVTARIIESTFIAIGIVSLLAIVTLRKDAGDTGGAGTLVAVGRSLVAIHDWTFLLGPGWIVGVGNGLILGYVMYRSGLVPRRMTMLAAAKDRDCHPGVPAKPGRGNFAGCAKIRFGVPRNNKTAVGGEPLHLPRLTARCDRGQ
jgi:hypothetical protein